MREPVIASTVTTANDPGESASRTDPGATCLADGPGLESDQPLLRESRAPRDAPLFPPLFTLDSAAARGGTAGLRPVGELTKPD